jgi:hypothetical protein
MLGVGNPAVSSRYESGAPRWRPGSGNNNSSSSGAVAPRAGRASPARSLAQRGATLVLARLGKVVSPRVLQAAERTTPGDEGTGGNAKRRVCGWPVARVWPHGSCVPFFRAAPNQTPITTAPAITTKAAGHKAPRPAPLAAGGTSRVPWRAESPATAGHVGGAAAPIRRALRGWAPSGQDAGGQVEHDLRVPPGTRRVCGGPVGGCRARAVGGDGAAHLAESAGARRGALPELCPTLPGWEPPGGHEVLVAETRRRDVGSVRPAPQAVVAYGLRQTPPRVWQGFRPRSGKSGRQRRGLRAAHGMGCAVGGPPTIAQRARTFFHSETAHEGVTQLPGQAAFRDEVRRHLGKTHRGAVAQLRLLSRTRAGCVTSQRHNAQKTPEAQRHATTTLPSTTADAIPLGQRWWVHDFAAMACVL